MIGLLPAVSERPLICDRSRGSVRAIQPDGIVTSPLLLGRFPEEDRSRFLRSQPAGGTNGRPPSVENSASATRGVTTVALNVISASVTDGLSGRAINR